VFKFISAGLARPHVPDAMVGKMLRPFGLVQIRTTLRTLMYCYSIHRLLPPPMSSWDAVPKPKDDGDMKTRPASCIVFFGLIAGSKCVIGPKNSREDGTWCDSPLDQVDSVSRRRAVRRPRGLKGGFYGVGVTVDDLQVRQAPKLEQLRPRGAPVFLPDSK
jgi:hypothetical protein